jgi:hypothetical protein
LRTLWSMSPGLFPTLRQRFRDHTLRKFLPKFKIMDKDIDLALFILPTSAVELQFAMLTEHIKKKARKNSHSDIAVSTFWEDIIF